MIKLFETRITSQGKIGIPKRVRERLHVYKGDKIVFFEDDKGQIFIQEKELVTRVKGKSKALEHLHKLKTR